MFYAYSLGGGIYHTDGREFYTVDEAVRAGATHDGERWTNVTIQAGLDHNVGQTLLHHPAQLYGTLPAPQYWSGAVISSTITPGLEAGISAYNSGGDPFPYIMPSGGGRQRPGTTGSAQTTATQNTGGSVPEYSATVTTQATPGAPAATNNTALYVALGVLALIMLGDN